MEVADYDKLWSGIPLDILGLISLRLVAADYFVFRAICKHWRYAPLTSPPCPQSYTPSPCLMTLQKETGMIEFFDPVYNVVTTQKADIPKFRGARIRSSKANWLLMSHGTRGMFFFNTISNDIIELPDQLDENENSCSAWTFSCPPDSSSSDCFVVGFETGGYVPDVYIIKVGDIEWTYHFFRNHRAKFQATGCNNPLFFKNNIICVLGDKGNLGTLSIKENSAAQRPKWKFYGKHFSRSKQRSIRKAYMVEDVNNGGMVVVFLSRDEGDVEVWRYKLNEEVLEREKITSLENNKTLFVSFGGSYLRTYVAQGLGNKIYLPMFHDNKGVFYCLVNRKYYSFDYSAIKAYSSSNIFNLVQPRSCIWIE
ncbi:F-box protein At4g00893-like [Solanum stenotomum]|uniref:F-box protein At4g00893-like n=1 Tax=Solanum stenotomum TaxID=172797 RepID=UPI0020D13EC7|nr:F-box protein At4g00893-like [Solanum stenotomum]